MEQFVLSEGSIEFRELRKIELQSNKLKSLDLGAVEKKFPNIKVLKLCKHEVEGRMKDVYQRPEHHFLLIDFYCENKTFQLVFFFVSL